MKKYDVVIIGFGKGGKTLASELSRHGRSVAVIERSARMYGGTCINVGCIPTKALIHSAALAAAAHPLSFGQRAAYYRDAVASKTALVDSLREKNYRKLADDPRIDVYTGEGSFLSPQTVRVKTADGSVELTAGRIVIDTGAETVLPPVAGLDASRRVYTSATILDLEELPRRLTIVGGGYIGLEFASMFAAFGSEVTVLEGFAELIPREDRDIAQRVREVMEQEGVSFRLGARVESLRDTPRGVVLTLAAPQPEAGSQPGAAAQPEGSPQSGAGETIEADAVLLATGRRPATAGLNLAAAGVETDARGAIRVDEHLRTTAGHIYAIGDVTGGLQFTYISLDDYRIVRDDLLGDGARTTANRGPVPYAVFIDPPLSHVGLHEQEALKAGLDVRVNRIDVASIPRARTLGKARGLLKAVIDNRTDRVLGCTLYGPESFEVINAVAIAMKHGITAGELSGSIYTHPSMSETLNDLFV